jgi:hypothetical protein
MLRVVGDEAGEDGWTGVPQLTATIELPGLPRLPIAQKDVGGAFGEG